MLASPALSLSSRLRQVALRVENQLLSALIQRASDRGDDILWMRRHDALTGLANRVGFQERVRALRRRNVAGSVVVIDLDHLKITNDEHGHAAGDAVVQAAAARLTAAVTADIVAGRWGGDEFVLFIPGPTDRAQDLLEGLLALIRQPVAWGQTTLLTTASIGMAELPLSVGLDQGLSAADMAMYAAKAQGRDRVVAFNEEVASVATARRELAKTVASLQEQNLRLEEQVQQDALTGLRSRRALDQVLESIHGGSDPAASRCSVVFLDIDHFGQYNKHHGDDQGDKALRQVAQLVQSVARHGDLVYRKGGEEIVAVLPRADHAQARQAAERMRAAVEQAAIVHSASPNAAVITVTVGVASSHGDHPVTVQCLMARAAAAAMRAKVLGRRNQVHIA